MFPHSYTDSRDFQVRRYQRRPTQDVRFDPPPEEPSRGRFRRNPSRQVHNKKKMDSFRI